LLNKEKAQIYAPLQAFWADFKMITTNFAHYPEPRMVPRPAPSTARSWESTRSTVTHWRISFPGWSRGD